MTIFYPPSQVPLPDAATADIPAAYDRITLDVQGMKCGGCVKSVERRLTQQAGVQQASVNLILGMATVTTDHSVQPEQLVRVLSEAGFPSQARSPLGGSTQAGLAELREQRQKQARRQFRQLMVALLLLFVSSLGHLSHALGYPIPGLSNDWFHAGLAAAALLIPGRGILLEGWQGLRHNMPNMNTLIGLGASIAFLTSLIALIHPQLGWDCFFDEPVMLIGFILLGRNLEQRAKREAIASYEALLSLQPKTARLIQAQANGLETPPSNDPQTVLPATIVVPVEHLRLGEWVQVLPGEQIPMDGLVVAGESTIDESMLTGESLPVLKQLGDRLVAGTLNQSGAITLEITQVGQDTTLSRIIQLVQDAQTRKAPIQALADTIAGYFTYVVITLALLTFCFWYFYGSQQWAESLHLSHAASQVTSHSHPAVNPGAAANSSPHLTALLLSLKLAIAVLVIACPCALGLATPTALLVGSSLGAQRGLLIRGGDVLEQVHQLDTIVFDKTGTLTAGQPVVMDVVSLAPNLTRQDLLQLAATVESGTHHPLARALMQAAQGLDLLPAQEFHTIAGFGIAARVTWQDRSIPVMLGNAAWMAQQGIPVLPEIDYQAMLLAEQGKTVIFLAMADQLAGLLTVADPVRPEAHVMLQTLKQLGLRVMLLTGDRRETAHQLAQRLNLSDQQVLAEVPPAGKAEAIAHLQAQGHRVGMVGDGINDAPALAQAEVGIALHSGTEVAAETAGIVLMRDRLTDVVAALDLSREILGTIRQNLFWAFAYNCMALPVAAGALLPNFNILLSPGQAGILMAFSSITVVLNSLRLHWKFRQNLSKNNSQSNSLMSS
jgi:P-type Cu2+ transporter